MCSLASETAQYDTKSNIQFALGWQMPEQFGRDRPVSHQGRIEDFPRLTMKLPAIQFYTGDWRKDPGVQSLSFHDRGVWFEILCLMNESATRGKLLLNGKAMPVESLARLLGISLKDVTQAVGRLTDTGVASYCEETGALMNRRMVRDEQLRTKKREDGKKGGNPQLVNQQDNHHVNHEDNHLGGSSSSSSSSSSTAVQEEEVQPTNRGSHPLLESVKTRAQMVGFPLDEAERFWNHFEASGWIDKNGHPIRSWESKLATWCTDARARPAEKAHHAGDGKTKQLSVFELKAILQAKESEALRIKNQHYSQTAIGGSWDSPARRDEFRKLRGEIRELNQRISKLA